VTVVRAKKMRFSAIVSREGLADYRNERGSCNWDFTED